MYFLVPFSDEEFETGEVEDLGDPGVDPELLELHFAAEMPENDAGDDVFPLGEEVREDADVDVEHLDAPLLLFPEDEVFDDLDGEDFDIEFRHEKPDFVGDASSDEEQSESDPLRLRVVDEILADFYVSSDEDGDEDID